jgi:glutaredoxin
MKTMVRVYTVENCPYCAELKEILKNEGVNFVEIDVNNPENEPEFNKLYEVTKCDQVPMVKIGPQILVPEVSFTSIREAADLTKKFLV